MKYNLFVAANPVLQLYLLCNIIRFQQTVKQ